jgi:hypothetical protein
VPRHYGDGLSLREIARRTYRSKSALARRAVELNVLLDNLKRQALETLEQSFISDGLCQSLVVRFDTSGGGCTPLTG